MKIKIEFAVIVLCITLFSGCGIPRAKHEQLRETCSREKDALQEQIRNGQEEIRRLKKLLSEKEQQYSSLFHRYESLSAQYLKLRKLLVKEESKI